jgi:cytoskeleton protein RodZ
MLRAIEADHYDQLPGGIFNKGFVRAFARAVGIDEDKAIEDYLAATEPAQPDARVGNELRQGIELRAQSEAGGAGDLPWGGLALALILIALAFAAWGLWTREERKAQTGQVGGASSSNFQSEVPAATSPAVPAQGKTNTPVAELKDTSSSGAAGNLSLPAAVPAAGTPAASTSSAKSENASSGSTMIASTNSSAGPSADASANSEYFSLRIKVQKDSWLSLSSDGKNVLQGTIVAPAVKSVRAHNQIVVKAGNVGALEFEFNGQRLPPQGNLGEVKDFTFGAGGLEAVQTIVPAATTGSPAQASPVQR